jgi:PAS domain S-box-containing protein/diguanylate cyclase (GGDEF)-like protein
MQRLSRHLLEQIVALDEDALVVTDRKGSDHPLIYVNAAFEQLTGYSRDEVVGQNCRFLQGEDSDPAVTAVLRKAVADAQACSVRLINYRKDGGPFLNQLQLVPLRQTRGGVRYYLGRMRAVEESSDSAAKQSRAMDRADAQGLLDIARFRSYANRDLGIARRQKTQLSMLLFRIAHLDLYRATFGNQAAESCLRMVGGRIGGGLRRAGDLCARLDADTFVALVLGQPEEDAANFARNIADQVRGMALHNPRAPEKFIVVKTSAAGGIPNTDDNVESLIATATAAL